MKKTMKFFGLLIPTAFLIAGCNQLDDWYGDLGKPSPTVYLSNCNNNCINDFHFTNDNDWESIDNKVYYHGDSIGKLTLYSKDIPTENKKPNRMIVEVEMFGNFDEIDDNVLWGISFGNKDSLEADQIVFGVNGAGQTVNLNGDLTKRKDDYPKAGQQIELIDDYIMLCFQYNYPGGGSNMKIMNARNSKYTNNHIVGLGYQNDEQVEKELSLFVYDPSGAKKIWFRNLKIWNDWTWND